MTQKEAIIAYIRKHGSITQMEAASVLLALVWSWLATNGTIYDGGTPS